MSTEMPSPVPSTVDPYKQLGITLNPDGSISRDSSWFPNTPAMPDPAVPTPVLSKDIPINDSKGTWMRLFLPRSATTTNNAKLPLVVYFHASGFVLCSPGNTAFHEFCSGISGELSVVVASVGYRLAPEHRLPAAYDDAVEVLHHIGATSDEWLAKHADVSRSYLMGSSAGSNIAYHVGLRLADSHDDVAPIRIRGLILHQPFFGGTRRTGSELRLANDPIISLAGSDLLWELALPVGADRDHEYSNPAVNGGPCDALLDKVRAIGWRYLVTGCRGDLLYDRQVEVARLLAEKGVSVESHFPDGGSHMFDLADGPGREALLLLIKNFISN